MDESRIKKTKRNFKYALILQITKILLVFGTRIIFVKELGAVYLGINGLFSNILSLLSIADLGITTAMMYSLYKPLAEHDNEKVSMYIGYFKRVYNVVALVVFALGMLLIPFLRYIVNLPENVEHIYLYYIIMVINTALTYLYVYKTTLPSADQKMYIISKIDTVMQLAMFVAQCVVLTLTKSFLLYLIVNLVCTVVGNVLKAKKTDKIYPYVKSKSREITKKEKKEIFVNVKSLFLYKIGGVLQSNTDNILISVFVGTIVVGYYSNYSIIVMTITTFISMIFTSLKASVGNHVHTNDIKEQFKIYNILETYNYWLVAFCAICFMELLPLFVNVFFGAEYVLDYVTLVWICLNFYTANIRQTLWAYRETTGMYNNAIKYVTLVTTTINVFLSLLFGGLFGLSGIIAATVIARMIFAWWKEPKIMFNQYFKESSKSYFVKYLMRLGYMVVVYLIIDFVVGRIDVENGYAKLSIVAVVTTILAVSMLLLPYAKSEPLRFVKKIVKRG